VVLLLAVHVRVHEGGRGEEAGHGPRGDCRRPRRGARLREAQARPRAVLVADRDENAPGPVAGELRRGQRPQRDGAAGREGEAGGGRVRDPGGRPGVCATDVGDPGRHAARGAGRDRDRLPAQPERAGGGGPPRVRDRARRGGQAGGGGRPGLGGNVPLDRRAVPGDEELPLRGVLQGLGAHSKCVGKRGPAEVMTPRRASLVVPWLLAAPAVALLLGFFLGPLLLLVRVSLFESAGGSGLYRPGTWSADAYRELLGARAGRAVIRLTVALGFAVAALRVLIRYPPARLL